MKFGYQQASHTFKESSNIFDRIKQIAVECEEQGYDSLWLMDHLLQISLVGRIDEPILDPYTLLAGLATNTSKIRLGTLCTCNIFRNPALIAKMGSTIDHISRGRFWLGIGAGWFGKEATMYGYNFPSDPIRLRMLEEALQIISKAWTQDSFSFRGKYYNVRDLVCQPRPLQKPHPPILVGGEGTKITLKLVAKYADACNLFTKGQELTFLLDTLKEHCKRANRPYSAILKTKLVTVSFGEDVDEARKKILFHKPSEMPMHMFMNSTMLGRPRDMIGEIEDLRERGIQYLMINFRGSYRAKDKLNFSRNVMSAF